MPKSCTKKWHTCFSGDVSVPNSFRLTAPTKWRSKRQTHKYARKHARILESTNICVTAVQPEAWREQLKLEIQTLRQWQLGSIYHYPITQKCFSWLLQLQNPHELLSPSARGGRTTIRLTVTHAVWMWECFSVCVSFGQTSPQLLY